MLRGHKMNKKNLYNYKLANLDLRLELNYAMKDKMEVFSLFRSACQDDKSVAIKYEGKRWEPLIECNALYVDKNIFVFANMGEVYCCRGTFPSLNFLSTDWTSCLHYTPSAPDTYDIYFHSHPSSEKDIFNAMCLDLIMAHHNRVILHSAYITYRGEGIVFTAPSGTGKSTQAELWANSHDDVEIINGDRSILSCDGDRAMVHGLPFCGTSGICKNVSAPLRAAVVLRQGRENRIRRLEPAEAIRLLMSECAVSPWDSDGTRNILDLLIRIVERIPVYYFSCVPDQSAVRVLEEALEGK